MTSACLIRLLNLRFKQKSKPKNPITSNTSRGVIIMGQDSMSGGLNYAQLDPLQS